MRFFTRAAALAALLCATGLPVAFAQTSAPSYDRPASARLLTPGPGALQYFGLLAGAHDDVPGLVGCQQTAVDHPDIWFAFVATGSRLTYTVQDSALANDVEVLLYDGPADTSAVLLHTNCGSSLLRDTVDGLVTGRTYYLGLASQQAQILFFGFNTIAPTLVPEQDCDHAVVLNQQTIIYQAVAVTGAGANTTEVSPTNSCWGNGGERQSKWYRFVAGGNIPLQFNINPNDPNDDYDWAVWDITTDPTGCTTKGSAVACNWTGQRGATGLSLDPSQEPGYLGGSQFDNYTTSQVGGNAPIMLQAGHAYALLVDNFTTSNLGYTLTFGGLGLSPNPNHRAHTTGLNPRFMPTSIGWLAMSFSPTVTVVGTTVTYHWTFGDGATSTLAQPTHTYAADGLYTVALTVTDVYGMQTTYGRTVRVGTVTGIPADVRARFSLAPNPAKGAVRLTVVPGTAATAQVLDGLGRVVRSFDLPRATSNLDLSLEGLRPGLYTVRVGAATRQLLVD